MNPSASKLELLERCPAAGALPSVWMESTDDQAAGTARHRFIQRAGEIGRDEALAAIPDDAPWRAQCEALDLSALPSGTYELAWAYDVEADTARCLGPWIGRAYDVSPTEVSGTVDLVCQPVDGSRWLVIDFKGDEEVEPAATNLQLAFYALCVARVHGLDEIDVAIVYLQHGGGMRWDRATLGPFELAGIATRVQQVFARVTAARALREGGGVLDYATGLHCRRCASLTLCPAQTEIVRAWSSSSVGLTAAQVVESYPRLSDEDAGAAWERLTVLEELLSAARSALRARAEMKGLPLSNGARLMPVEVPRRVVVLDKALPVLAARFGPQAEAAVERSLSMEAVGKLARQLAPGKGQRKAVDELLEQLRAAGGIRETRFVQLRVKKARGAQDGES